MVLGEPTLKACRPRDRQVEEREDAAGQSAFDAIADRYDLITALHIPIAAQLIGAAFFVVVIFCIQRTGLRHPVLARHWGEERAVLEPAVEFEF